MREPVSRPSASKPVRLPHLVHYVASWGPFSRSTDYTYTCDRQTQYHEDHTLVLVFRDGGKDRAKPWSATTLKSQETAQLAVSKLSAYQSICQVDSRDGECVAPYSPLNWAAFLGSASTEASVVEGLKYRQPLDNASAAVAACLNTPVALYQQALDKTCYADFQSPPPCATDGGGGKSAFSLPADVSVLEGPFRAMCVNGSRGTGVCGEALAGARDVMFGTNWDCDTLETKYTRIVLPAGYPQEDQINSCNYDWVSAEGIIIKDMEGRERGREGVRGSTLNSVGMHSLLKSISALSKGALRGHRKQHDRRPLCNQGRGGGRQRGHNDVVYVPRRYEPIVQLLPPSGSAEGGAGHLPSRACSLDSNIKPLHCLRWAFSNTRELPYWTFCVVHCSRGTWRNIPHGKLPQRLHGKALASLTPRN